MLERIILRKGKRSSSKGTSLWRSNEVVAATVTLECLGIGAHANRRLFCADGRGVSFVNHVDVDIIGAAPDRPRGYRRRS